jgi:hypothetical protein
MHYFAFGLAIESDVDLGLPAGDGSRVDLRVREARREALVAHVAASPPGRWLSIETHVGTAAVTRDGDEVVFAPESGTSLEEKRAFLLGMVMLQVLSLRGALCLHGSAVLAPGGAVALVGPSGAGKSTIAASLARAGCELLSDDMLPVRAIESGVEVLSSYPSVRLWDDSMRYFGIDPTEERAAPRLDGKYVVAWSGEARPFAAAPGRLVDLSLLARDGRPGVGERLEPSPALALALLSNALAPQWISDRMQRERLATVTALAERVRIRTLVVSPSLDGVQPLAREILEASRA